MFGVHEMLNVTCFVSLCFQETPIANLFLDMLEKFDIPLENFGDSTGNLNVLAG